MIIVLLTGPAVAGLTTPEGHQGHGPADADVATDSHHGEGNDGAPPLANAPIFAGADTSQASEEDLMEAKALIEATREAIGEAFSDVESALAAGYVSIGDGRRPGSFEHYIRRDYLSDGHELNPNRIESLVYQNTGDGHRLVSGMYILESGSTMEDIPPVAGELAVWHDHENLCWDDKSARLAGIAINGRCVPGGTLRRTAPMLHVWLDQHPCGPFAGIERRFGGGGCSHDDH